MPLAAVAFSDGGRLQGGQQLQSENGDIFLFVDGNCDAYLYAWYHMGGVAKRIPLSREAAVGLSMQVLYSEWSSWFGEWFPNLPVFDAPKWSLTQDLELAKTASCYQNCEGGGDAPDGLVRAVSGVRDWIDEHWGAGTPLDREIRYVLVRSESEGEWVEYGGVWDWPLADVAPSAIALSEAEAVRLPYGSGRVAAGSDAGLLREVRSEYLRSAYVTIYGIAYIVVRDASGAQYRLWMRDALPFEDSSGLVRPR